MLEHTPDDAPPPVAAPRHLRRRRFHTEIPDTLLVPDAEPVSLSPPAPPPRAKPAQSSDAGLLSRDAVHRRKRQVARLIVLFVAIIVPALVLALLLLG
ncbi:hypothetical protein ABIC21_001704 [Pseudarthrobacter sp. PvP090]